MTLGAATAFIGLLWAALWRWGHDRGLLVFGRAGVWPAAPTWLRGLARADDGDVNVFALANEIWAVAALGVGIWLHLMPPGPGVSTSFFIGLTLSLWIPAGAAGAYVAWRHWRGSG
jgi:hypothetical protein